MNLAFNLQNMVDLFGPHVDFGAWWGRLYPNAKQPTAKRRWERIKRRLRQAGIEFDLVESPSYDGQYETTLAIQFESSAYMRAMIDALIGPA